MVKILAPTYTTNELHPTINTNRGFKAPIIFVYFIPHKLLYRLFQNEVVNINRIVNNSKRPMSISKVLSHLALAGKALHEKEGPKVPNAGPMLPTLLTEIL